MLSFVILTGRQGAHSRKKQARIIGKAAGKSHLPAALRVP